jgi:hypothetical protein
MGKLLFIVGVAVALTACGESSGHDSGTGGAGTANPRLAAEVCDELCGWPDECFTQLGVPLQGADCVQTCEAQVEVVGVACVRAISTTIACLGTCDVESLTLEEQLACQDEAEAISSACD